MSAGSATPHVEAANRYARAVVDGRIVACRYVQLACRRHVEDLGRVQLASFPYRFDAAAAERACRFVELLPHTKGDWARGVPGQPGSNRIRLEPWQCFVLACVFGWLRKSDGRRRFRTAYHEIPRKNGKSQLAAGVGLYMLAADGEMGAEVYSGATTEKQAWEVFRPARLMALRTPAYQEGFGVAVGAKNLHIVANGSRFEPVIGKPGDGASPSCAIVDEYHEHATDDLYATMETGMGARRQPLMYVITTAGVDTSGPCYALRSRVVRMLEGTTPDDELFGVIWTIDEGDDWTSEAALKKANPNYGVSVSGEFLRSQQRVATENARQQNTFLRKHLDVWTSARTAWMNMERWNALADPELRPEQFAGEPCCVGLDLASKVDLTAAVKLFERQIDGVAHYYVFGRYYLPETQAEVHENAHYRGWIADGYLTATDGDVIDYDRIRDDLLDDDERYAILQLGYDPWGATQLATDLGERGIEVVEVPMRVGHLSEPMKWVEAMVMAGRLHHDGNPCMSWMMSNVTAKVDANDNVFPRKDINEAKIDGPVALIIAMSRALTRPGGGGSIYDSGESIIL